MLTEKQLNRVTVKVTGGVDEVSYLRYSRAQEHVTAGDADWVWHPVSDRGKGHAPEIRFKPSEKTQKVLGYDEVRRSQRHWLDRRIPFVGDLDRAVGLYPKGKWSWSAAVRENSAAAVNGNYRKEQASCSAS